MDFFTLLQSRQSIRAFKDRSIDTDMLRQILDALNRAPSAGNLQAYEVYLVSDAGRKAELAAASGGQEFLCQAPVVLAFCADSARSTERYGKRGAELYCVQDATIACTFALLAAAAIGLASVWVGAFDEQKVRRIIGAPAAQRPVAMLPIGYPDESPPIRPRRPLTELVHYI